VHGSTFDTFYNNSTKLIKIYITGVFRMCNRVIVLSNYWKDFFKNNIKCSNTVVVSNSVNPEEFEKSITEEMEAHDFLFLGKLCKRKGIYDLIEATNELVNKQGHRDLHFWLAGDGDLEKVKAVINRYRLCENVHLLGWLDNQNKLNYLRKAGTLILPSYHEGFPIAILEAMASGKVIITSSIVGIPEIIINGENGYLIEPGNIRALCNCILTVKESTEKMKMISKINVLKVKEYYNAKELNEKIRTIYTEILVNGSYGRK
jgi:glycosyltransferase involved in cell wall biosynthesis